MITAPSPLKAANAPWVDAQSPYQLADQTLNSVVRVRAVDKAGNEYVATLIPEEDRRTMTVEMKIFVSVLGTLIFAFLVSGVVYYLLRSRRDSLYGMEDERDDDVATEEVDEQDLSEDEPEGEEGVDWEYVEYEEEYEEEVEEEEPKKKSRSKK